MEIKQRIEQRKLLIPELRNSLNILTLPSLDLRSMLEEELINNPLLDEAIPENVSLNADKTAPSTVASKAKKDLDLDLRLSLLSKKISLQD
ncbi:hypothetical protein ACFL2J_05265, partial [Candidatus Omnitrophota bacterium]